MDRREILATSGALAATAIAGCLEGDSSDAETDSPSSTPGTGGVDGTATDGGGTDGGGTDGGVTGTDPVDPSTADPSETTADGEETATPDGTRPPTDERLARLARDNATFALDLHRQLAKSEGGNLFLSPYSVSVALAMTFAGARGETREQMRETLRYTLGEEVHAAFADLRGEVASRSDGGDNGDESNEDFQLSVANALWGREGFPFDDAFVDLLDEHYGAGLESADFAGDPDGERARINEWVAELTEDRIEDLLPPGAVTPNTALILTNAIYFQATWLYQFDPDDTADATFTALDGTDSTVPMMGRQMRTDYVRLDSASAIELPYRGRDVSMVLLLPDEGEFEAFEESLDGATLLSIFEQLGDASGEIRLPRFEYETEARLSDPLSALGMPTAFGSGANFGGMVEGDGSLLGIDDVYHQSFVSVDEEGTEAAAATAVPIPTSQPPRSFDLTFDRPFLFCIRDRPTDAVLFLGRVTDAGNAQG